eukprot:scaffold999_cov135-Isochrysis_galbana.AAC.1
MSCVWSTWRGESAVLPSMPPRWRAARGPSPPLGPGGKPRATVSPRFPGVPAVGRSSTRAAAHSSWLTP